MAGRHQHRIQAAAIYSQRMTSQNTKTEHYTYTKTWDCNLGINLTNQPVPPAPLTYSYPFFPPNEDDYVEESVHNTDTIPQKVPELEHPQEEKTLVSDDQWVVTDYDYNTFVHNQ